MKKATRGTAIAGAGLAIATVSTMVAPGAFAYPPGVDPDAGVVGRPPSFNTPFTLVARRFDPSCKITVRIWNTGSGGTIDRTFSRGPGLTNVRINTRIDRLIRFHRSFKMTATQTCGGKTVVVKRKFTVQPF